MRSATELSCAKACSQQKVKPRRDKTIRINIPPLHRLRFVHAKKFIRSAGSQPAGNACLNKPAHLYIRSRMPAAPIPRSEEHTSELQSRLHLVCRLLLEKKR